MDRYCSRSGAAAAPGSLAPAAGAGPDDDDEDAVAVLRAADDGGVARLGLDVRGDLGQVPARQPDAEPDDAPADRLRRDVELAVARHRPALRRADRHLGAAALERRV